MRYRAGFSDPVAQGICRHRNPDYQLDRRNDTAEI
uniref:Uncharacterized protein n=1 Tax=Nelumbo nucifera TaxID=4432 RepID=A0A822XQS2_NELNU|nr:TPA_asm: hypothetical protein HUJ06_022759 [Nelumbo nucifera]